MNERVCRGSWSVRDTSRRSLRFAGSKPAKMLQRRVTGTLEPRASEIFCASDGHTITQLSAATRRRYGSRSPYFIPATFLYQLRTGVTPHVCQIVALSENTGYRFVDWLRMFGFDLHQIPRLQIRLHPQRTTLVTPMEDASSRSCPNLLWIMKERGVQHLAAAGRVERQRRYLFAKIGSRDAAACPELLPGSIVRVDRYYAQRIRGLDPVSMSRLLWLVEQPGGLTCSQVRWIDDRQIVLLPSRPPWGSWPLHLPTEARILGLVGYGYSSTAARGAATPGRGRRTLSRSPAALPARTDEVFGLAPNLAWTRGLDLPGGASAHSRHRSNPGKPGVRNRLRYAFRLRGHGRTAAPHCQDIESLCRLLHGCSGVDGIRRRATSTIPRNCLSMRRMDRLHVHSEFPNHAARSGRAASCTGYAGSAGARTWKITADLSARRSALHVSVTSEMVTYQSVDRTLPACDSRVLTPPLNRPYDDSCTGAPLPAILSQRQFCFRVFRRTSAANRGWAGQ